MAPGVVWAKAMGGTFVLETIHKSYFSSFSDAFTSWGFADHGGTAPPKLTNSYR